MHNISGEINEFLGNRDVFQLSGAELLLSFSEEISVNSDSAGTIHVKPDKKPQDGSSSLSNCYRFCTTHSFSNKALFLQEKLLKRHMWSCFGKMFRSEEKITLFLPHHVGVQSMYVCSQLFAVFIVKPWKLFWR